MFKTGKSSDSFLEKHRSSIILVLSGMILVGSGVSLGVGLAEIGKGATPIRTEGFVVGGSNEPMNRPTDEPIVGLININAASAIELELLPGIGPTKAAAIVSYRKENGPFKSISEIQNVSGIGPATYAQIKDQITVK